MAILTTTDNSRTVNSNLTDAAAALIVRRIPMNHKDRGFAVSLAEAFRKYGAGLTHNRRVWMHILANQQLTREAPAAPVMTAAVVPAPSFVAPAAPVMTADEISTAAAGQSLTMLMYDIPDAAEIANPSGRLRRIGLRLNLSVWLVPTGSVPHTLINELIAVGSSVITAPYDTTATAGLLAAAIGFANREVTAAVKRAEESKAAAEAELNSPEGDPNQKRRVYDRKMAAIAKRLELLADEMKTGAAVFGLSGAINFGGLRSTATTLAAATTTKAAAYANATAELAAVGTADATAMANAMGADAVPFAPAADMLRDNGKDDAADSLQAAFDDANVFSLVSDEAGE
jgi:hypothetical protein